MEKIKSFDYISFGKYGATISFINVLIIVLFSFSSFEHGIIEILLTLIITPIIGFIGGMLSALIYNKIYVKIFDEIEAEVLKK